MMAGANFNWGSWLLVADGANHLAFIVSPPARADRFPFFPAILLFVLSMFIVIPLCGVFKIYTDTPQGTAIWLPSSVLLTIALLWLFGFIPGGTVRHFLIWGLYGLGGLLAVSLVLSSIAWLAERKSKRSKDLK